MRPHLLAAALLLAALPASAQPFPIRTVARASATAPDTGGLTFSNTTTTFPSTAMLNIGDRAAFNGGLTIGGTVTAANNIGTWAGPFGGLQLVAREGSAAPGTGAGVVYADGDIDGILAEALRLNASGQVMLQAAVSGTGVTTANDIGIWAGPVGGLQLVAREGSAAPGTAATFTNLAFNAVRGFNNAGQVAFDGGLSDGGNGLWAGAPGALALVARNGGAAPGTTATFSAAGVPTAINDNGVVAFQGNLTGAGVTLSNDQGLWVGAAGAVQLLAREGSPAPGTAAGVNFLTPASDGLHLTNAGTLTFATTLSGTGINSTNDQAIYRGTVGNLTVVARKGNAAVGLPAGVNYGTFGFDQVLNGSGQLAFRAVVVGTGVTALNDDCVWTDVGGTLQLIMREGDGLPGAPGVLMRNPPDRTLHLNASGSLLFSVNLSGTGVTSGNDQAFVLWTASDGLRVVLREGDFIDIDNGPAIDLRRVDDMALGYSATWNRQSNGEDGGSVLFGDDGRLIFTATLQGNQLGIFEVNTNPVPEPTGVLAVGLVGVAVAGWVRRRRR